MAQYELIHIADYAIGMDHGKHLCWFICGTSMPAGSLVGIWRVMMKNVQDLKPGNGENTRKKINWLSTNTGMSPATGSNINLSTRTKRLATNAAFFLTVPGPKMIWQFLVS